MSTANKMTPPVKTCSINYSFNNSGINDLFFIISENLKAFIVNVGYRAWYYGNSLLAVSF